MGPNCLCSQTWRHHIFLLQIPFRNLDLRRAADFSSFAFLFSICRLIDPGWHSTQFVVCVLGGRPKAARSTTRFVRTVCPNVLLVFEQADSSTMYHDKATTRRASHVFYQGPPSAEVRRGRDADGRIYTHI